MSDDDEGGGFKYVLEKGNMLSKFNRARGSLSDMLILLKGLDEAIVLTPDCCTEPLYVEYRSRMVERIQVLMRTATTTERLSAKMACKNTMKRQPKMVRFEKIFVSGFVNSILECEEEVGRENTVIWMSMDYMYHIYQEFGGRYFDGRIIPAPTANDVAVLDILKAISRELDCYCLSYVEFQTMMTKLLVAAGGQLAAVVAPQDPKPHQHSMWLWRSLYNKMIEAQKKKNVVKKNIGMWCFVCEDVKAEIIRDSTSTSTIHCQIYYPQVTLDFINLSYAS